MVSSLVCLIVVGLGFEESQTLAEFRTYSMTSSVPDVGKLRTILGDRVTITFELDPKVRWDSEKADKDQRVENLGSRWYFGRSGKGRGMWPCRIRCSSGFYIDQDSPELVAYSGYGMDGHDFCRMNNNFIDLVFKPDADTEVFIGWMGLAPTGLWSCSNGEISVPDLWSLDLWAINQVSFNVNGVGGVSMDVTEEIPFVDHDRIRPSASEGLVAAPQTEGDVMTAQALVGLGF
jgi:hypothetical protein